MYVFVYNFYVHIRFAQIQVLVNIIFRTILYSWHNDFPDNVTVVEL